LYFCGKICVYSINKSGDKGGVLKKEQCRNSSIYHGLNAAKILHEQIDLTVFLHFIVVGCFFFCKK